MQNGAAGFGFGEEIGWRSANRVTVRLIEKRAKISSCGHWVQKGPNSLYRAIIVQWESASSTMYISFILIEVVWYQFYQALYKSNIKTHISL